MLQLASARAKETIEERLDRVQESVAHITGPQPTVKDYEIIWENLGNLNETMRLLRLERVPKKMAKVIMFPSRKAA